MRCKRPATQVALNGELRNLRVEEVNHRGREHCCGQVDQQPHEAGPNGEANRLVDVAFAGAGEQQHVLARFFLDDVDDVVDSDHADETAGIVDHGG